jgi:hypothetical protein
MEKQTAIQKRKGFCMAVFILRLNRIFTSTMKNTIIGFIKMPKTAKILIEVAVWRLKEMYILIG